MYYLFLINTKDKLIVNHVVESFFVIDLDFCTMILFVLKEE